MKKNISITLLLACTLGLLWSCEKDLVYVSPAPTTEGLSFIKIVHAAPNFRQVFKGADSFNIYVNGLKVNAGQLTYNSIFPTTANLYAAVPSGAISVRITVNGKVTPDSITLASLNKVLVAGSYYSFFITDEALTATESRQIWVKDNFALTDTNNFSLRFVHAVLNDPGAVDVYSFKKAANIFSNITPATATAFVTLPYVFSSDTFYVRSAGTLNEIARVTVITGTGNFGSGTINRGRPYTLLYKGGFGNTVKPRGLVLFAND